MVNSSSVDPCFGLGGGQNLKKRSQFFGALCAPNDNVKFCARSAQKIDNLCKISSVRGFVVLFEHILALSFMIFLTCQNYWGWGQNDTFPPYFHWWGNCPPVPPGSTPLRILWEGRMKVPSGVGPPFGF